MDREKKVILLAGPTSSGKSKLAIKLAQYIKGEIINADSMQVYKEVEILTSRPKSTDTKKTKHHLYGFISVKNKFSTGDWLKTVIKKINKIWKKDLTPIIVGGTGLYFKALAEGLVNIPNISNQNRLKVRKLQKKVGQKNFFKLLIKIDPLAKKFLIPTDVQRSLRAYEIKKFTNKSFFEFIKETKPNFDKKVFIKMFINTPREILKEKIEGRVEQMFKDGAVQETKKFLKMKINKDLSANKIIGINEIKGYLKGKTTLIRTKELINVKTRQYAKRQFTWARGHMKSWKMVYSSDLNDLFKKSINKIF